MSILISKDIHCDFFLHSDIYVKFNMRWHVGKQIFYNFLGLFWLNPEVKSHFYSNFFSKLFQTFSKLFFFFFIQLQYYLYLSSKNFKTLFFLQNIFLFFSIINSKFNCHFIIIFFNRRIQSRCYSVSFCSFYFFLICVSFFLR
jgi:hypothetical protein